MAVRVLLDAYVMWDSVDLSDHVRSVTLNYSAELLDDTAMGDTTRSRIGGLKDWSADIEFFADEASGKVQATVFDDVGTTATLIIRPDNSEGVGSTNPNYTGTGIVESIPLVAGSVGELQMAPVRIVAAGALSRAES
jgi:predicted secreted protein